MSCELHLEPGRYEILPKITATRNKSLPTLDKVVKQFADRNPQKLRQVGMQYDLAHAKGGIIDEDLEVVAQKEKERKKAIERKKKEKAAKTSVEVKIQMESGSKGDVSVKTEDKGPVKEMEGETAEDAHEKLGEVETLKKEETHEAEAKESLDLRLEDRSALPTEGGEKSPGKGDHQVGDEESKKHGAKKEDGGKDDKKEDGGKSEKEEDGGKSEKKEKEDEKNSDDSDTSDSEEDDGESRWNAVCVTCLRVYSQDKDLTISLVKPKDAEEASSLIQGHEPAGATM